MYAIDEADAYLKSNFWTMDERVDYWTIIASNAAILCYANGVLLDMAFGNWIFFHLHLV